MTQAARAARRNVRSASRQLRRRGVLCTLEKFEDDKDKATGKVIRASAGPPVEDVLVAIVPLEANTAKGRETRESMLLVEGAPLTAAGLGDLDEDWRVELPDGSTHGVVGPVTAQRTAPDQPASIFIARVETGSTS